MPCETPRAGLRRSRLLSWTLGAAALTAGATTPPAAAPLSIPDTLRRPCAGPDPAGVATVGDLAAFSVRQEAALQVCEARRSALVEIEEAYARVTAPTRRWWSWLQR